MKDIFTASLATIVGDNGGRPMSPELRQFLTDTDENTIRECHGSPPIFSETVLARNIVTLLRTMENPAVFWSRSAHDFFVKYRLQEDIYVPGNQLDYAQSNAKQSPLAFALATSSLYPKPDLLYRLRCILEELQKDSVVRTITTYLHNMNEKSSPWDADADIDAEDDIFNCSPNFGRTLKQIAKWFDETHFKRIIAWTEQQLHMLDFNVEGAGGCNRTDEQDLLFVFTTNKDWKSEWCVLFSLIVYCLMYEDDPCWSE